VSVIRVGGDPNAADHARVTGAGPVTGVTGVDGDSPDGGDDGEGWADALTGDPATAMIHGVTAVEPTHRDDLDGAPATAAQPHPLVVSDALARTEAETLIVTGGLAQGQLRDIAWMLQGTGVELLVIPTPADIEGLRSEIRPVAGLPLLYLDR
jgi:hypothetical protein